MRLDFILVWTDPIRDDQGSCKLILTLGLGGLNETRPCPKMTWLDHLAWVNSSQPLVWVNLGLTLAHSSWPLINLLSGLT